MQRAWQFKLCQACGFTVYCCSTGDANSPVLWTKQLLQSILFAQVDCTIVNFAQIFGQYRIAEVRYYNLVA